MNSSSESNNEQPGSSAYEQMFGWRPLADRIWASSNRLIYVPISLLSWDGVTSAYCLHATAYDGKDWTVTFHEQDLLGSLRRRTEGAEQTAEESAKNLTDHLPGIVVGHVVKGDNPHPQSFTEEEATAVFSILSGSFEEAQERVAPRQLSLVAPLALGTSAPVLSDDLWLRAIPATHREETLGEAFNKLTPDSIGQVFENLDLT